MRSRLLNATTPVVSTLWAFWAEPCQGPGKERDRKKIATKLELALLIYSLFCLFLFVLPPYAAILCNANTKTNELGDGSAVEPNDAHI